MSSVKNGYAKKEGFYEKFLAASICLSAVITLTTPAFAHAKGLKYSSCVSYTRTGAHHMELNDVVAIHYFNRNSQPFTIQ